MVKKVHICFLYLCGAISDTDIVLSPTPCRNVFAYLIINQNINNVYPFITINWSPQ